MRSLLVPALVLLAVTATAVNASSADRFHELNLVRPGTAAVAPAFKVPGLGGGDVRLADCRGKVVLLNFWATWCPPCKEEMPSMENLYRRFKARGFTILAISIDTVGPETLEAFAKRLDLTFQIGLDPKLEVANLYTVRVLPATFLINRRGRITALALGPRDWDSPAAHALMEILLK